MELIVAGLYGLVGGVARAIVGLNKSEGEIDWNRLIISVLVSIVIGTVAMEPRMSLLAGYAGSDMLEGITKRKLSSSVQYKNSYTRSI